MTTGKSPRPCEQFTVLQSRTGASAPTCDVCDMLESVHENPGRRVLSGGEVEELRRQMIVQVYDLQEEPGRANDRNGAR